MRGSRTTSNLILAGALGLGSLVIFAAPALAETPPHQAPGFDIAIPEEQDTTIDDFVAPTPEPEVNDDKVAPTPDPGQPDPMPQPNDDKLGPNQDPGDPEPQPQPNDDKLGPNQEPGDGPGIDGPDDITSDPGCTITHGDCGGGDEPTPEGHCFDGAGNVADVSECMPSEDPGDEPTTQDEPSGSDDGSTEVEGSSTGRSALPHTGAGISLMAAAGLALVGAGTAARKAARR
jgi:hypothetical protein